MQPQSNPYTEIGVVVIAVALIAAATVLLVLGKADSTEATLMFGLAVGVFGVNGAYKAPSPTQQAQIAALLTQVLSLLPQPPAPTPKP